VGVVVDVERLLVLDPVGARDARVAHVDHLARRDVHEDPERHEGDEPHREPARARVRNDRRAPQPRPEPHPQHPRKQVRQHRIDERHRGEHEPLVEEEVGDPEREQRQQVEVAEA
jgi:hypothetical protein